MASPIASGNASPKLEDIVQTSRDIQGVHDPRDVASAAKQVKAIPHAVLREEAQEFGVIRRCAQATQDEADVREARSEERSGPDEVRMILLRVEAGDHPDRNRALG
jgi:hypothetical protein